MSPRRGAASALAFFASLPAPSTVTATVETYALSGEEAGRFLS